MVGLIEDGLIVGVTLGEAVGCTDGETEGDTVVGFAVGEADGFTLGELAGLAVAQVQFRPNDEHFDRETPRATQLLHAAHAVDGKFPLTPHMKPGLYWDGLRHSAELIGMLQNA